MAIQEIPAKLDLFNQTGLSTSGTTGTYFTSSGNQVALSLLNIGNTNETCSPPSPTPAGYVLDSASLPTGASANGYGRAWHVIYPSPQSSATSSINWNAAANTFFLGTAVYHGGYLVR